MAPLPFPEGLCLSFFYERTFRKLRAHALRAMLRLRAALFMALSPGSPLVFFFFFLVFVLSFGDCCSGAYCPRFGSGLSREPLQRGFYGSSFFGGIDWLVRVCVCVGGFTDGGIGAYG